MRKNGKLNTTYMVEMALLIAIILIMAFTPIGYIKTFGLEITLIVVPVAVGAVTLGPAAGSVRTDCRCNFRRRIWTYKFYTVLRNERIWSDALKH